MQMTCFEQRTAKREKQNVAGVKKKSELFCQSDVVEMYTDRASLSP